MKSKAKAIHLEMEYGTIGCKLMDKINGRIQPCVLVTYWMRPMTLANWFGRGTNLDGSNVAKEKRAGGCGHCVRQRKKRSAAGLAHGVGVAPGPALEGRTTPTGGSQSANSSLYTWRISSKRCLHSPNIHYTSTTNTTSTTVYSKRLELNPYHLLDDNITVTAQYY